MTSTSPARGRRSALAVFNRLALAVAGAVLLLGGGWLALTGAVPGARLPDGWPGPPRHATLLDRGALGELRAHDWWLPTALGAAAALTLLFAVWCAGQLGGGGRASAPLMAPSGSVRTDAVADALALRAGAVPGVDRCRCRVRARRGGSLRVDLVLRLDPYVTPDTVLPALRRLVAEAETAAAPCTVRASARITAQRHRATHVR
ncbi:hypothetical protein [Streptomyces sp. NPDC050560]|uniref:hypothetical protein n=1 Tax=Streptomyces sp. NPDC050560 TaxID=3365630 RepID=UPI0037B58C17